MYITIGKMYVMSIISMFNKGNHYTITLCPNKEDAYPFKMTEDEFNKKYGEFLKMHEMDYQFSTSINF